MDLTYSVEWFWAILVLGLTIRDEGVPASGHYEMVEKVGLWPLLTLLGICIHLLLLIPTATSIE
ncbi:MAG: hypothetical protein R2813_01825 [Flavobacteriales bacterium]